MHQRRFLHEFSGRLPLQVPGWLDGQKLRPKHQRLRGPVQARSDLHRPGQRLPLRLHAWLHRYVNPIIRKNRNATNSFVLIQVATVTPTSTTAHRIPAKTVENAWIK